MVVGLSGAPSITVAASVEEVFNTGRENVTIQSKFVGNIAMKYSRSTLAYIFIFYEMISSCLNVNHRVEEHPSCTLSNSYASFVLSKLPKYMLC